MARFRAYTSDSSSEEEEEKRPTRQEPPKVVVPTKHVEAHIDQSDESEDEDEAVSESESSAEELSGSEMLEEELSTRKVARRDKNALVQDDDGEIRYAHEINENASVSQSHVNTDPTIIPWAQQLGVDAKKMHVMQTSLFRMPEEAAALKALNQPPPPPKSSVKRLEFQTQTKPTTRKHGRESDVDGSRIEQRERRSFAYDVEPLTIRPSRKYARVDKPHSIINGQEGLFTDAGLAFGRSFRVGWGPGGTLVHLGSICGPNTSPPSANSSVVNVTNTSALLSSNSVNNSSATGSTAASAMSLSSKLLQHHLSRTPITLNAMGIPVASPKSSSSISTSDEATPIPQELDFASFTTLFPTTDISNSALMFRLGVALFDPIDLHFGKQRSSSAFSSSAITPDIRNRVTLLRRKAALGKWLEDAVKSIVESDLRTKANGLVSGGAYTPADTAFTYLTGYQLEKACTAAIDGNYIKLSTLITQAGGDEVFRDDIREQLRIWKSEQLGPGAGTGFGSGLVGRGVWKVYALLGGILDSDEEDLVDKDADVYSGLDWKRLFGLCLWYGQSLETPISSVVKAFETLVSKRSDSGTSKPTSRPSAPWLLEVQRKKLPFHIASKWSNRPTNTEPYDPLYALIKLHADPALSLSNILDPLSFSSSCMEAGIATCWHLYIILSRVMQIRDFNDRRPANSRKILLNGISDKNKDESSDDDGENKLSADGHSPTADLLSSTYAFELESWGMIQEAIFVLLHIESSVGREKAIKELIGRSAPHLDEWMTRGIIGSLKIPMSWVEEAKAQHALSNGEYFSAYELFLSAGLFNAAHSIAVPELAPDAILGRDLELLKDLLEVFDMETRHDKIDGWFVKGKILLDYVRIMTLLPKLQDQVDSDNQDGRPAVVDATVAQQIDELTRKVPRIIGMLPDVFNRSWTTDPRHAAATEEMVKNLLNVTDRVKPMALAQIQQPTLTPVDGATKVGLVSSVGLARFVKNLEA